MKIATYAFQCANMEFSLCNMMIASSAQSHAQNTVAQLPEFNWFGWVSDSRSAAVIDTPIIQTLERSSTCFHAQ